MSAMPKKARLGPFVYRLTTDDEEWALCDADPANHYGYTDHKRGVIVVHSQTTEDFRRVVLLHELMHAAAFAGGVLDNRKRTEEEFVVLTAPMLLDSLQRSPKLAAYLRIGSQE